VGELAAGIAHEIGNPIAVIQGYMEMLSDADLSEEDRRNYLRIMEDAIQRVSTIIRDLLDFARPVPEDELGGDAVVAAQTVEKLLGHQKRLRHVTLTVEGDAETAPVPIPSGRLEQVLINLLFNAADATPEGGHVSLRVTTNDGQVMVEVSDDGAGISEQDQERIFDPFFTTKDPGEGTGLGLAICHGLIESYGGAIQFESTAGQGTTFQITLPAGACPPSEDRSP
jgi:signal transduction histidine kinase